MLKAILGPFLAALAITNVYADDWVPPVQGKIYGITPDAIWWWNMNGRVFNVEWREKLTDGSWQVIGEGIEIFKHNNPNGFYRVVETGDVVFPVWNGGTSDLSWYATSSNELVQIECLNTNIPPEWGEGYIIVRDPVPCIIDVWGDGGQHMQVTIEGNL